MLARRSGYLRTAFAVLALIGQLTPAVALPLVTATKLVPTARTGPCGASAAACACSAIERAAAACCCSEPKPVPAPTPKPELTKPKKSSCCEAAERPKKLKSCCESALPEPKRPEVVASTPEPPPVPGTAVKIVAGGKCKCDKSSPTATSEPSAPYSHVGALAPDASSAPGVCRWAALVANELLPPPYPPPRA